MNPKVSKVNNYYTLPSLGAMHVELLKADSLLLTDRERSSMQIQAHKQSGSRLKEQTMVQLMQQY